MKPKAQVAKKKIDKLDFIKTTFFWGVGEGKIGSLGLTDAN